ncbi:MAG: fimbrillin family protein, partial [Candidatus Cryptobacteroides sp.]
QTEKYDNGTNAIALTFNHYLTQVVVKAKNSSSKHTVVVDGVKLANLAGEGTYSFSDNKMTATDTNVNSDSSSDYSETFTAKTLTAEAQEVMTTEGNSGRWYLIPQTVKPWDRDNNLTNKGASSSSSTSTYDHGTYLALKVKISASSEKIYPITGETSAWMAVPVPDDLKFEQGKKYNVTVDFFSQDNNGAGYVDPEDPGELDGDTTNSDAGKKISGIIKFSATVNTWGDSVDITISL